MSRRKPNSSQAAPASMSSGTLILMAVLAGAVGSGITWMLLPPRQAPAPSNIAPSTAAPAVETPPSVAHLPPGEAALLLGHWHYDRQRWSAAVEQYEAVLRL